MTEYTVITVGPTRFGDPDYKRIGLAHMFNAGLNELRRIHGENIKVRVKVVLEVESANKK
jgi:hypothetical protein